MTSFETVAIIVLIILAIAIAVLKSVKNANDDNETNDEEIKGYIFDGIDDVMSTIKTITGRTVEDTKTYVTEEVVKKLTTLKEESGIKINLSQGTITELIGVIIDSNFKETIDEYVEKCNHCGDEITDCTCEEETVEEDAADVIKDEPIEEPVEETITEDVVEEPADVIPNEEYFDTLKDDEGNEVDVPAGDLTDEPEEIAEEETDTVEEDTTVEEPVEEAAVEEEQEEVHTTEDCSCIECMTKPQIKAWAADHGIFVSSKMLKDDMIAKVKTEFEAQTAEV